MTSNARVWGRWGINSVAIQSSDSMLVYGLVLQTKTLFPMHVVLVGRVEFNLS